MPPRKQRANQRPKDLNAPKRAASSYILFNKTRQKTLRVEHPDKKLTDLTKIIGAQWKQLTAEEKLPFDTEANAAKAKYKIAIEEYKQTDLYEAFQTKIKQWKIRQAQANDASSGSDSDSDAPPPKPKKRPKDPNAPKKSLSAFFVFQTSRRTELKAEHPDKKNTELSKMTGAEWNAMSADQKAPFEATAREKKAAYQITLAAYKETEEWTQYQATLAAWQEAKKNPPKRAKKKKKVRSPSPAPSASETGSSDSKESSDDDEDTPMPDRRGRATVDATSSSGEEYSSDESD